MPQPIQPLIQDERGVTRFQPNAIVQHLLDNGGIDMNQIARLSFSREDRVQFAQLIGYSLVGASTLSYMTDEVLQAAQAKLNSGMSEAECRANALRAENERLRNALETLNGPDWEAMFTADQDWL